MLFDLRGRGRRRTIQGLYLGLAVLMGGGLVFFGVGGTGVGLFGNDNGGGGGGGQGSNAAQVRAAEKATQMRPNDQAAWADLTRQRLLTANQGKNYDPNQHAWTPAGKAELVRVDQAWQRYLALNPPSPDESLATQMANAYSPEGLDDPKKVTGAFEVLTQAQPSNPLAFAQLAQAAYAAKQIRKGDLAAQRALELAPADQRKGLKAQLGQAKTQAALPPGAQPGAAPGGGQSGATPGGAQPTPVPGR